jgi:hypothetical protein
MILPKKDYYRLGELADAWKCTEEDIFHWHGQGAIELCVLVQEAGLVGLDANGQVLGYYRVSGILSIPKDCAVSWALGGTDRAEAEAVYVDPDYPPVIQDCPRPEFHDMEPSNYPPNWAPGCSWITPDGNHWLIREFRLGIYFGRGFSLQKGAFERERIVVHAVERERFERAYHESVPSDSCPAPERPQDGIGDALDRLLLRTLLALRSARKPKPTAKEVWRALELHDDDGIIKEKTADSISWMDPDTENARTHSYHACENRLAPIRKGAQ